MKNKIFIEDMTCNSCENKIKKELKKLKSLKVISISSGKGYVEVEYNNNVIDIEKIKTTISKAGYTVGDSSYNTKDNAIIISILSIMLILYFIFKGKINFNYIPDINNNLSYGLLLAAGFFTSFHCISMCGGIALSQGVSDSKVKSIESNIYYNIGRVASYTILGGIIGGLGSVLTPTNSFKTFMHIFIGLFMILIGLNMFGILNTKTNFLTKLFTPIKAKLYKYVPEKYKSFFIGLLNGFMPCGPLQTMQIYAIGTASILKGSLSLFFFVLGTIPMMLFIGIIGSIISGRVSKIFVKISGIIIILLSILMIQRGLSLSGISFLNSVTNKQPINNSSSYENNVNPPSTGNYAPIKDGKQIITMTVDNYYNIQDLKVKKDIPVEINIDVVNLNGCIETITIPSLKISKKLTTGNNTIEFTPDKTGRLVLTCWMGMSSTYIDVE